MALMSTNAKKNFTQLISYLSWFLLLKIGNMLKLVLIF